MRTQALSMCRHRRRARLVAIPAAVALLAAACGADGAGDPEVEPADETATDDESADDDAETDAEPDAASDAWADCDPTELEYATGNPENFSQTQNAIWFMEQVEARTEGCVTFSAHYGGSLHGALEIMPAMQDGRLDMGYTVSAYQANDFPFFEVSAIPFTGDNPVAFTRAFQEMYEQNDLFREQMQSQNLHILAFQGTNPAATTLAEPIDDITELQGQSLRAVGFVGEAFSGYDINAVAIDPAEMYESVQRGVIDGIGGLPWDGIVAFGLHEVAPHVVNTGIGLYAQSSIGISMDSWESLSPEVQEVMEDVATELLEDELPRILREFDEQTCSTIDEVGGTVTVFDEEDFADWREAVREPMLESWVTTTAERSNADEADVRAFYDDYIAAYERHLAETDYVEGMRACAEGQL